MLARITRTTRNEKKDFELNCAGKNAGETYWNDWRWIKYLQAVICWIECWQRLLEWLKMNQVSPSCDMPNWMLAKVTGMTEDESSIKLWYAELNAGKTYWNDWRWIKYLQAVICRIECWQSLLEQLKMSEESSGYNMLKWMLAKLTGTTEDEWRIFRLKWMLAKLIESAEVVWRFFEL